MEIPILGNKGADIINHLTNKENVLVGGLSGMGTTTLARNISIKLKEQGHLVVSLFPFESEATSLSSMTSLIEQKLGIPNLDATLTQLRLQNKALIVVFNKIDQFNNIELWHKYIDNLRKSSFYTVAAFETAHLKYYLAPEVTTETQRILFDGFISDTQTLVKNLCNHFNIKKFSVKDCKRVFDYALGHAGLTKALIYYYHNTQELPTPDQVLANPDLSSRLSKLFEELDSVKIDLTGFGQPNEKKSFEELGLVHNGLYAQLPVHFFNNRVLTQIQLAHLLTSVELELHNILSTNSPDYTQINDLIETVNKKDFSAFSDWTVYKHLNNLNKKLKPTGKKVENKRSFGYRICDIS